jgi:MFS family permease
MEIKAQKIDYAAGGFLRHRFLRTVAGAALVLITLVLGLGSVVITFASALDLTQKDLGEFVWMIVLASLGAGAAFAIVLVLAPRVGGFADATCADFEARRWRELATKVGISLLLLIAAILALYYGVTSAFELTKIFGLFALFTVGAFLALILAVLISSGAFALGQSLWRRLLALGLGAAWLGLLALVGALTSSVLTNALSDRTGLLFYAGWAILALVLSIATLELLGQAFWQLTATKEGFRAARGWHPPIHHLVAGARRNFGLPGFLAHFGKARFRLAARYFLIALCNALVLICVAGVPLAGVLADANNQEVIGLVAMLALSASAYGFLRLGARLVRETNAETTTLYQTVREWDARAGRVSAQLQSRRHAPDSTFDRSVFALHCRGCAPTNHG